MSQAKNSGGMAFIGALGALLAVLALIGGTGAGDQGPKMFTGGAVLLAASGGWWLARGWLARIGEVRQERRQRVARDRARLHRSH